MFLKEKDKKFRENLVLWHCLRKLTNLEIVTGLQIPWQVNALLGEITFPNYFFSPARFLRNFEPWNTFPPLNIAEKIVSTL